MQRFIIRITQENIELAKDKQIGCFILPDNFSPAFTESFIEAAHQAGNLVLFYGKKALDYQEKYAADGVVVDVSKEVAPQKQIKQIRQKLKRAVIGVITRNRRHEAMLVSECEPDFVIFRFWRDGLAANRELLQWYQDLFLLQNAVWPEEEIDWRSLPVDFVILTDRQYAEI